MNLIQLRAMIWLRWRLTWNQWQRGGGLNAAIAMIVTIGLLFAILIGGVVGLAGGAFGLSQASPHTARLVWDALVAAFLFWWATALITELQRSEILDLGRLLYLPVSVRDVFLLNYVATQLTFSLALMLPAMLGLTLGLMLARGPAMLLLLPLVVGFFFMITAWTYCLRGWLAALMVNKRRRRAIIMGITMAFVLLSQLPNLLTNVWFHDRQVSHPRPGAEVQEFLHRTAEAQRGTESVVELAHECVPLLWLPLGAKALAEGNAWPAIFGAVGLFAIGTWGLTRAYRATLRFYQGGETAKPVRARPAPRTRAAGGRILLERRLPAIPEEAAAVALAGFRSMSRAPEVKMGLATNVCIFIVIGAGMLVRHTATMPDGARPLVASGAVLLTFLGIAHLMCNHFGFDRSGFRTFVLVPTPRRYVLLGKNLALLPAALAVFVIYLGFATVLAHLRVLDILSSLVEFCGAYLALSTLGNVASILAPYRISAGSLRPTKTKGTTMLLRMVMGLLLLPVLAPFLLPAGLGLLFDQFDLLPGSAVTLASALLMAVLAALLYWRTLAPLGRLLQQREKAILQVVTQEVE